MTIKKNGGIFGRNPTFNNVNIDGDLTVAGAQTFQSDQVIKKASPTLTLFDTNDGVGLNQVVGKVEFYGSDGSSGGPNNRATIEVVSENSVGNAYSLVFKTSVSNGVPTEVARFTASKNLAFQSGQGIDFSATAGTGTSELLDDYEEGTWTPVISDASSGGNTASITVVGAKYIKVGKIVHLYARINNINTAGMTSGNVLSIQGLPFTSGVDVFSCGSCVLDRIGAGGDTTINPRIDESSSFIQLSVTSSDSGTQDSAILVSDVGSTGSDIHSLQITYEAS